MGHGYFSRRHMMVGSAAALTFSKAHSAPLLKTELLDDFLILHRAFEALHPGLLRYNTKTQMEKNWQELRSDWSHDQSLASAYLALSRFLAKIKCGHSYANFYNQKESVANILFAGKNRVPFHFRWIDGRMIITNAFTAAQELSRGTEVVAIDNQPVQKILSKLLDYVRADGSSTVKRIALLEVQGEDRYETFDIFYALLFPRGSEDFHLTIAPPGTTRMQKIKIAPIDLDTRRGQMNVKLNDNDPQWTLSIQNKKTGLLTMPSWGLYNSTWDWTAFLAASFETLRSQNIKHLIVDIRANEGGLDCGDAIIARLIDRDLPRTAYERRVRYRTTPADLDTYLDTWDPSFKNWGTDAVKIDEQFYRLSEKEGESRAAIKPVGPKYDGKLSVLIGPTNSSATFQFAALIQQHKLGRLIGTPTGGNLRGINGGAFFFLRLPQSGLEADLPLIGTFPITPQPDAGVIPDILVQDSIVDSVQNRDAALMAALNL
jgi:hypothetical protein